MMRMTESKMYCKFIGNNNLAVYRKFKFSSQSLLALRINNLRCLQKSIQEVIVLVYFRYRSIQSDWIVSINTLLSSMNVPKVSIFANGHRISNQYLDRIC